MPQIRDALPAECNALTELCLRSKASWGYSPAFLEACRDTLTVTPTHLDRWHIRVAVGDDGSPAGVAATSISNTNSRAELELMFVDPAQMHRGIGAALIDDARAWLRSAGARELLVLSDPQAEPFYLARGAIRLAMRPSDAIVDRRLPWLRIAIHPTAPTLISRRLVLRPWHESDREPFARLNADPRVARYLPSALTRDQSDAFVDRLRHSFGVYGFGLWAVERTDLDRPRFIGAIGLMVPRFSAAFMPCVEIGWRLAPEHWGSGLATEGARRCLAHAFGDVGLEEVVSFTTTTNAASRGVMERIGMRQDPTGSFEHPALAPGHPLRPHVLYRVRAGSHDDASATRNDRP